MRWIACVLSVLLAYCPAFAKASAGRPAPAEEATTQPAKIAITPGKDTTVILGPLNDDGTANYVAALNEELSRGVTPENNAMIPLLKAFGAKEFFTGKEPRRRAIAALGLKRPPKSDRPFVFLYEFIVKHRADPDANESQLDALWEQANESLRQARRAPWSAKQRPTIAAWLAANEKALELIVEASSRPCFYLPLTPSDESPWSMETWLWVSGPSDEASGALAARATFRARAGDIAGACSDLLAGHRLGRLIDQRPTLWGPMHGRGIDLWASATDVAVAASGRMSAAEARAYLAALGALPSQRGLDEVVDRDGRFMALDTVMSVAREGRRVGNPLAGMPGAWGNPNRQKNLPNLPVNWDEVLRTVNRRYDRAAAICRIRDPIQRERAEKTVRDNRVRDDVRHSRLMGSSTDLKGRLAGYARMPRAILGGPVLLGQTVGDIIASFTLPPAWRVGTAMCEIAEVRFDLAKLSMALVACKAETGRYPARLAELAPKILPKIPADRFGGKPLIYSPSKDGGGYVLYSIGANLKDDGGKDHLDQADLRDGDIVAKTP